MSSDLDKTSLPKPPEVGDTGATIRIEHPTSKAAIVSVIYPDDRRHRDARAIRIVYTVLCLIPAIVWFVFRSVSATITSAIVAIYLVTTLIRQSLATSKSYVFRADHTGLTIETSDTRHNTAQHFTLGQIVDINLGFSFHNGPNSLFRCWMDIKTSLGNVRCLHNLGGDHLAHIANALREALGMPKRSWP